MSRWFRHSERWFCTYRDCGRWGFMWVNSDPYGWAWDCIARCDEHVPQEPSNLHDESAEKVP